MVNKLYRTQTFVKPNIQGTAGCILLRSVEPIDLFSRPSRKTTKESDLEAAERMAQEKVRRPGRTFLKKINELSTSGGFGIFGSENMISLLEPITDGGIELDLSHTPTVDDLLLYLTEFIVSEESHLLHLKYVQ